MNKIIFFGLMIAIMPNYVFGASARYEQLVAEKQQKMAELEKCTGNVNAWKIAGISTIGLTAVGVVGNIALANTKKGYDSKISSIDAQISNKKSEIARLEEQKRLAAEEERRKTAECEIVGGEYKDGTCTCKDPNKEYKNGDCVDKYVSKQYEPPKETPTNDCTETAKKNDDHVVRAEMNGEKCEILECDVGYQPTTDKQHCELKVDNTETDCTADAQKKDKNVTRAVKRGGKCEVTACAKNYTPSSDKTKCVKKTTTNNNTTNTNRGNNTKFSECMFKGKPYQEGDEIDLNCTTDDTDCVEMVKEMTRVWNSPDVQRVERFAESVCYCFVSPIGVSWTCAAKSCKSPYLLAESRSECVNKTETKAVCQYVGGRESGDYDLGEHVVISAGPGDLQKYLPNNATKADCTCKLIVSSIDWSCDATECERGYALYNGYCTKIIVNTNTSRNAANANIGEGCDRVLNMSGSMASNDENSWSVVYAGGNLTGKASCDSQNRCSCYSSGPSSGFTVSGCKIKPTQKWVMVNPVALPLCEKGGCAKLCADGVKTNASIRRQLFEATKE